MPCLWCVGTGGSCSLPLRTPELLARRSSAQAQRTGPPSVRGSDGSVGSIPGRQTPLFRTPRNGIESAPRRIAVRHVGPPGVHLLAVAVAVQGVTGAVWQVPDNAGEVRAGCC